MKPAVIVVEGIIGCGKETLINEVCAFYASQGKKVVRVLEPVEKWKESGLFDRFYNDPKRWAYHFQTKAFHDRVKANQDAYKKYGDDVDLYILERSPFSDQLFMNILFDSGSIDNLEMQDYKEWWSMWYQVMPYTPSCFIYLNPSLEECMRRLKLRSREGESGITVEYQTALKQQHDLFFAPGGVFVGKSVVPVFIFQSDQDFKNDPHAKQEMCAWFDQIFKQHHNLPSC